MMFSGDFLTAALLASLSSVAVLVGLFFYLNYHTRRDYFTIWGVAWLFYGLWLVLRMNLLHDPVGGWSLTVGQWSIGTSAVFLWWGSLSFMGAPTPQRSIALFLAFVYSWAFASRFLLNDPFLDEIPVFWLAGLASLSAAIAFFRLRRVNPSVGATLLSTGFSLWATFLGAYPFAQSTPQWRGAMIFLSSALQLFIAVSMIVLMLEEHRASADRMCQEIQAVKTEKETLQIRIVSAENEFRQVFGAEGCQGDLQSAYRQLRQTQQTMVQQERLRALGQMASGFAHDLNNSLTPIVGFTDFLLDGPAAESTDSRKYLECIRAAAGDISQMVERVRQFYRRRDSDELLPTVELNAVVQKVLKELQPKLREVEQRTGVNLNVVTELAPDLSCIREDETEVTEALTNLVKNAIEAMPHGGTITVATRLILPTEANSGESTTAQVILEVTDPGVGMDEVTRQRCLEPFFSTKGPRASGLGLSMVYGLMRRHQGSIEIETAIESGTTVRLVFHPGNRSTRAEPRDPLALSLPPLRILCIDDDRRIGAMLQQVLKAQNHLVEFADGGENGLVAFRTARQRGQAFQVVITDLGMPNVDGRQIVKTVKSESPETPVILLTGWAAMVGQEGDLPKDADVVLTKPANLPLLYAALARVTASCAA